MHTLLLCPTHSGLATPLIQQRPFLRPEHAIGQRHPPAAVKQLGDSGGLTLEQSSHQRRQPLARQFALVEPLHGSQARSIIKPVLLHQVPGQLQMRRQDSAVSLGQPAKAKKQHLFEACFSAQQLAAAPR